MPLSLIFCLPVLSGFRNLMVALLIVFVISFLSFGSILGLSSSSSPVICPGVTNTGYKFSGKAELITGIDAWESGDKVTYGSCINSWNVTAVDDMSELFLTRNTFNDDIGCWDVSKVTVMGVMFFGATDFNKPIGKWDVGKVTDMGAMFTTANNFNQPLGEWDVSSVNNTNGMFVNAVNFNQDISKWNVRNVNDFQNMFNGATVFDCNEGVSENFRNWKVSGTVTDMFSSATALNDKYNIPPRAPSIGYGDTPDPALFFNQ